MFNISYRKVGGIRFLKLGRITLSWSVSSRYKKVKAPRATPTKQLTFAKVQGTYIYDFNA